MSIVHELSYDRLGSVAFETQRKRPGSACWREAEIRLKMDSSQKMARDGTRAGVRVRSGDANDANPRQEPVTLATLFREQPSPCAGKSCLPVAPRLLPTLLTGIVRNDSVAYDQQH